MNTASRSAERPSNEVVLAALGPKACPGRWPPAETVRRASSYDGFVPDAPVQFSDVVCSFCGRHNREVRVVTSDAGLIICQVCVAKCAVIFDQEVGVDPPVDWSDRWPPKT